jgi:hypothetical protein
LGIFFGQKLQTKCGIWGIFFQSVALWEIMSQMVAFGSKNRNTENERKFHAVSWDKVTTPKWMGGLGLRNLENMNQACFYARMKIIGAELCEVNMVKMKLE